MAAPDELNQRLQALWQKFRPVMLARLKTIAEAIRALESDSLANQLKLEAIHVAHKLAGSLGTFSLHKGSAAAQEIERLLNNDAMTPEVVAEITRNFDQLKQDIESAQHVRPSPLHKDWR